MVELRKRKTPPPAPEKPSKKKPGPKATAKGAKAKSAAAAAAAAATEAADHTAAAPKVEQPVKDGVTSSAATNGAKSSGKPEVGKTIDLEGFGGEIETNDGTKTSLKKLVDDSKAGVVLFTYPKASTPGCTKQACLFRDNYSPLTANGLSVYGLSADSPKSNTTFKTKQTLPYTLLCDPSYSLIKAIGLAKPGNGKGTVRGVFVVNKAGKVLAAEPGGPDATLGVAQKIAAAGGDVAPAATAAAAAAGDKKESDEKKAEKSEGNGEKIKADGEAK